LVPLMVLPAFAHGGAAAVLEGHDAIGLAAGLLEQRADAVAHADHATIETEGLAGKRRSDGERQAEREKHGLHPFAPLECGADMMHRRRLAGGCLPACAPNRSEDLKE